MAARMRGMGPGCCCIQSCTIENDTFDTAISLETIAGTWSVSSATAQTSSSNAILISRETGEKSQAVIVDFKSTQNGDAIRTMVRYLDADNYLWGEVAITATCGELRLYSRVGGVNTELGVLVYVSEMAATVWHRFHLCYDDDEHRLTGTIESRINDGTSHTITTKSETTTATDGRKAGFGTGTLTGSASFDNFKFRHLEFDNEPCEGCNPSQCIYFEAATSTSAGAVLFSKALNCQITVVSGSWSIGAFGAPEALKVTGPGKILLEPLQPQLEPLQRLSVYINYTASSGADGDKMKLSVDYIDDNNRHYAEGSLYTGGAPTTPTGKVARVSGGAETVLYDAAVSGSVMFYQGSSVTRGFLCIQNNTVNVTGGLVAGNIYPATMSAGPVGGFKAALEIDQGALTSVAFDDIALSKITDQPCPAPTCTTCWSLDGCQISPESIMVTLSGVANGTSGGTNCTGGAAFNGSYTCSKSNGTVPTALPPGGGGCTGMTGYYSAYFTLSPKVNCGFDFDYGRIIAVPGEYNPGCTTIFTVWLEVTNVSGGSCFVYSQYVGRLTNGTPTGNAVDYDCTALSNATYTGGGYTGPLDTTAATYIVDAL